MGCIAIFDTACVLWDVDDYDQNQEKYFSLKDRVVSLLDVFERERPKILLRDEMLAEMLNSFPYDRVHREFHDYNYRVLNFLSNIPEARKIVCESNNTGVASTPVVSKTYFSPAIQNEVSYILTYIHSTPNPENCYFAHPHVFLSQDPLSTDRKGVVVECETVFFDDDVALAQYFSHFRRIFEPNPVHHNQNRQRARKSMFRCYNGDDTIVPQDYLDRAIFADNRYYFYDAVNSVYIVFHVHLGNRYHGFEENDLTRIPVRIRQHFNI